MQKDIVYGIFDFSSLYVKAFQAIPDRDIEALDKVDIISNVVNIFLYYVASNIDLTTGNPVKSVVCFDAKPYLRYEDFPSYKQDREVFTDKKLEVFRLCKQACLDFINCLGFGSISVPKAEADDLIAHYLEKILKETKTVVYSSDSDLLQFLSFNRDLIFCYWSSKEKKKYFKQYDYCLFCEAYPSLAFNPELHKLYLSLTGGHNNALKIKGLGNVSALKLISEIPINHTEDASQALNYLINNVIFKGTPLKENSQILNSAFKLQTFPYEKLHLEDKKLSLLDFSYELKEKELRYFLDFFSIPSRNTGLYSLIEKVFL